MVEKVQTSPSLTEEEKAAKLAALDAQMAGLFADMDHDEELRKREQDYRSDLAHKNYEKKSFVDKTVYVDVNAKMKEIYTELESEESSRNSWGLNESPVVLEGESYTIPDISSRLQGEWRAVTYELEVPDEVVKQDNLLAVAKGGARLQLDIERMGEGYFVELVDKEESSMTRLRLSGYLESSTQEEDQGRMRYLPGEDAFLHPSVVLQTESSLLQLLHVLDEGGVTKTEDHDEPRAKNNNGKIFP